ncbi:MAG: inositol monophosphatase [Rhodospirillaceae bacterium]|nr:inositol monophosphatase [Rhodospirillaceae bacterium]
MILAVRKASKPVLRDYGEIDQLNTSKKGTESFVNKTEMKLNKILLDELVKSRPEWSLLFRENNLRKGKDELHTWVIEPLDGVKNISHGIPYFSISIAAMNENEVVAGVIYDPLRDEMFVSEKGNGSFVNDKRLRVSARKNIKNAIFSSNAPNARHDPDKKIHTSFKKIKHDNGEIRFLGSSALDFAYVAAGRLDGLWHNCLDFCQIAAGSLIISEAGGMVNIKNNDTQLSFKKDIIAGNVELYTKLLSILK